MPDTPKFLYLDPAGDVTAHASDTVTNGQEDTSCCCCEASLSELIAIIRDCGQDPATQLSGYLITEDPTYLPESNHARAIASRVGRDRLLTALIELYIRYCPSAAPSDRS